MAISGNEKSKAQRVLEKIESGNFDDNDVDNLFMRLRAYCADHEYFREIADFVAHNDQRYKGVAVKSLEALYLSFRFFTEYISTGKALDISQSFPAYVKKLMKYQVEKCNENDLRTKFNVTRQRLCSRIDSSFKEDKTTKTVSLNSNIGTETLAALKYILGFIGVQSAFTQTDLLTQTLSVFSQNGLKFDEKNIVENFDKITLCILVLLHNTSFSINSHRPARCELSCEKTAVVRNMNVVNEKGEIAVVNEDFGFLSINGLIPVLNDGKEISISYSLFSTTLRVDDWCDNTLFSHSLNNGIPYAKVDLSGVLGVSKDFKIYKNKNN